MIKKEHTRNQKRMYRIHKQDEKILAQELIVSSLQQENERLNNILDELEKELELNLKFKVIGVRRLKNKLKELKEENK